MEFILKIDILKRGILEIGILGKDVLEIVPHPRKSQHDLAKIVYPFSLN